MQTVMLRGAWHRARLAFFHWVNGLRAATLTNNNTNDDYGSSNDNGDNDNNNFRNSSCKSETSQSFNTINSTDVSEVH
jgi:hypothetical protein